MNRKPLTQNDFKLLEASFISKELAELAGLFRVESNEGKAMFGHKGNGDYSGIVFSYYLPEQESPRDYRLRRDNPELEQNEDGTTKEKNKYTSAFGSYNKLYFPPKTQNAWLSDVNLPLAITEGEKKTLALSALSWHGLSNNANTPRFLPVGLSGVWNWRGTVGKTNNTNGKRVDVKGTIADLNLIKWQERQVFIIFDSNVSTNESVEAARRELAKELNGRSAIVRFVELPQIEGVNGIDDLLALKGVEYVFDLIEIAQVFESGTKTKPKSQSSNLVELAKDAELFHTSEGEAYATFTVNNHRETYSLKSKGFRDWLSRKFYESQKTTPSAQALQDALNVLNGNARFDGKEKEVHTRLAEQDSVIWLDLCNDVWSVVRIDANGWQIENDAPVKFRRNKGMKSLPEPTKGGNVHSLRSLMNMNDKDFTLLLSWLVSALRPSRPFPILAIHGEQGSAKSTISKMVRALIDPNIAPLRSQQRDEKDLMLAAINSWIVALDNLSAIPIWLSDALCRLSTGGGFSSRTLYENDEETIFQAMRPVILNGIEELATRSDLLSRCVVLNLPTIPDNKRRQESEIWKEFELTCPSVLGALLTALSQSMRDVEKIQLESLPRMADFALWSCAAETALGLNKGDFLRAYTENREGANEMALEASPVAPVLIAFVNNVQSWQGTASDLLKELNKIADEDTQRLKHYPKQGNVLGKHLKRLAPNLRDTGIKINLESRTGKKRIIILEQSHKMSSQPSQDAGTLKQLQSLSDSKIQDDSKDGSNNKTYCHADLFISSEETHKDCVPYDSMTTNDSKMQAYSNDVGVL